MKFGSSVMGVRLQGCADAVGHLERVGFESVWVPEHLAFPVEMPPTYPYTDSGQPPVPAGTPCYDPWAMLAFLACASTTLRLATNVCILPLHHPLETARSVVTVDRLSGGRVTLGIGVGWLRDEYEWAGQDFSNRGARADEIIELLRRLWADGVIEHRSDSYDIGPIDLRPKPLQRPGVPIEVGGSSSAALRRAGRLGDGWIEIGTSGVDDLAEKIEALHAIRTEAGRADSPFEITVGGPWSADLDAVRRARDLGVTRVMASPFSGTPLDGAAVGEWADAYRERVIEPFNAGL